MAKLEPRTRVAVLAPVDPADAATKDYVDTAVAGGGGGAPAAHAATHGSGGSDPVTPAAIGAAADADVVHNTGTETIGGAKTFDTAPAVPVGNLLTHPVRRDDARLTDQRVPTDSSVTDTKVSASAAIAESKLALASDAAAGTASRRTLGTGATQAAPGNHNHDGVYSDTTHTHGPRVTSLASVGNGGTITPNAATTDLARVTTTGAGATLAPPSNAADTAVMNVEILANVALSLTVSGSILLTAGITSPIAVGAGKRLFLGLRCVGTTWYLLASAPQS